MATMEKGSNEFKKCMSEGETKCLIAKLFKVVTETATELKRLFVFFQQTFIFNLFLHSNLKRLFVCNRFLQEL